jgi:hypothetical protein
MEKRISIMGAMMTAIAFVVFPVLLHGAGAPVLLAIVGGAFVATAASRPVEGGDRWMWQKDE